MYEMTINGVPLLFDAEDADEMEKLEFAYAVMDEEETALDALRKKEGSSSAVLRGYCMMYRNFFDNVFGNGTAEKIFSGQKMKPSVHEEAYLAFLDALLMQKAALADKKSERWRKYTVRKPEIQKHDESAV